MLMHPSGRPGSEVIDRAPVVLAVDREADPQVLAGPVALPLPAGLDEDGDGVGGLPVDPLDPAAQLLRRPQRVDQLEVVVGKQGREERPERPQQPPAPRGDLRSRTALGHLRCTYPQEGSRQPAGARSWADVRPRTRRPPTCDNRHHRGRARTPTHTRGIAGPMSCSSRTTRSSLPLWPFLGARRGPLGRKRRARADAHRGRDWDLMVADIELPGINGLEFIRTFKRGSTPVATLVLSGHASFDNAVAALRAGADDFMRKPVEPAGLIAKVDGSSSALTARRTARAPRGRPRRRRPSRRRRDRHRRDPAAPRRRRATP